MLFAQVRDLKEIALWIAFRQFVSDEWDERSIRAGDFAAFAHRERWWLDDYALFQACAAEWPGGSWRDWPATIARREPAAVNEVRRHLGRRMMFEPVSYTHLRAHETVLDLVCRLLLGNKKTQKN